MILMLFNDGTVPYTSKSLRDKFIKAGSRKQDVGKDKKENEWKIEYKEENRDKETKKDVESEGERTKGMSRRRKIRC